MAPTALQRRDWLGFARWPSVMLWAAGDRGARRRSAEVESAEVEPSGDRPSKPVDEDLRRRERRAIQGAPEALQEWIRARRRAGEVTPEPRDGDHVRGDHLAALLVAALGGRREVELLRSAGAPERRHGRMIDALRGLVRGEPRPWSAVRAWADVLALDLADLALVAVVEPAPPPPPRPAPTPHPLTTLPERPCCGRCRSMVWAVALGAGVRCSNPASSVGLGGHVPGLHEVCPAFEPRADAAP